MRTLQVLTAYTAVGLGTAAAVIGGWIARDVDKALGTTYGRIWSPKADIIWKEHERLFPMSHKRAALIGAFVGSVVFFILIFLGL